MVENSSCSAVGSTTGKCVVLEMKQSRFFFFSTPKQGDGKFLLTEKSGKTEDGFEVFLFRF